MNPNEIVVVPVSGGVSLLLLIDRRQILRGGRPVWSDTLALGPGALADGNLPALLGAARCYAVIAFVTQGAEDAASALRPWPGPLGKRVFENIGREAWQQWLAHQTMLINENRLSPLDPKHRAFLEAEMEKFLFGDGAEKPAGYVPPAG